MENPQTRESRADPFAAAADGYSAELRKGLALSGEDPDYFAATRVQHLASILDALGSRPSCVMDFGCGVGLGIPHLRRRWPHLDRLVGVDRSEASLAVARAQLGSLATFHAPERAQFDGAFDLVFTNGVFHHIPLRDRDEALAYVRSTLRPGGLFAFWENNPWNPGTRLVMRRIPFDRDAILVWPAEARSLMRRHGLRVIRTDSLFLFPRALQILRPLERCFRNVPVGAQYLVLAQKEVRQHAHARHAP